MEPIFENYWKLLSEKNAACRIISTIFVHLLIMLDIFASSCKDTKRTRLLQHTIAKNLHKQPQNRHRRRRFADLDDIDSPTSTMSIQRLWKRGKRGFGKVQEVDTTERKLEKYSDTENMKEVSRNACLSLINKMDPSENLFLPCSQIYHYNSFWLFF